jgi:hypothetical protein
MSAPAYYWFVRNNNNGAVVASYGTNPTSSAVLNSIGASSGQQVTILNGGANWNQAISKAIALFGISVSNAQARTKFGSFRPRAGTDLMTIQQAYIGALSGLAPLGALIGAITAGAGAAALAAGAVGTGVVADTAAGSDAAATASAGTAAGGAAGGAAGAAGSKVASNLGNTLKAAAGAATIATLLTDPTFLFRALKFIGGLLLALLGLRQLAAAGGANIGGPAAALTLGV